jgi:hypothetical protein
MIRAFKIYVALTILGLSLKLYWDLNHVFEWIKDGDFFFGVGIALIIIAGAIYIDSTKSRGWQKVFTRLALFTAVSNLCDEVMFNPYIVSWQEWVTALSVLIGVYFYERYKRNK